MKRSGPAIRFICVVTALFLGVAAIQICVHGLADPCDEFDGLVAASHAEHGCDHDDAAKPKQHSHNDGDHHDGCTCLCHAPFAIVMVSLMPDFISIEYRNHRDSALLAIGVTTRVERPPQASLLS